MVITSLQNPRIKQIAKLRSDSRERRKEGLMLVEGFDEIALAQRAGYPPQTILVADDLVTRRLPKSAADQIQVSQAVFRKLSYRENPDGWMAVFTAPTLALQELHLGAKPLLVVLEAVEKPGNLGAILRTCDAARADAVVVCDQKADLYGPNVVRASRGTVFTVPAALVESRVAIQFIRQHGLRIIAATPDAGDEYTKIDLTGPIAIAVGTEDTGLTDAWIQAADARVRIPMHGRINSLNVSVAVAVLVYEVLRQRGE